ncbi:MAG: MFS transporter [Bacillota bacterium]|nr:MFS transporter [Bacillota bacterium]
MPQTSNFKEPGFRSYFRIFKVYPFLPGIGLVSFFSTVGLAVIIPTLPLYLKNTLGFNAGLIGLLLSVYATTETLAKTPFGIWSDRFGRRPLILFGLLLAALVPLGFMSARSPLSFIFLQVLNGLGVAAYWPILSALIADGVRVEERATALSVINMAYLAALGVGPALGTYLNHFLKTGTGAFQAAAVLLFGSFCFGLIVLPRHHSRPAARQEASGVQEKRSPGPLPAPPRDSNPFPAMLFISLLQQFGIGLLAGTFILYINRQLGFSQGEIGTALLIPAAAVALLALPLGEYADRIGKRRAVQFAYLISAGALALVPFSRQIWELVLAVAFLALAYVAGAPAWLALASAVAPAGRKGTALAGISTMQSFGFILGSPAGGFLYDHLHPRAPLFASSAILVACLVLALIFLPADPPETPHS